MSKENNLECIKSTPIYAELEEFIRFHIQSLIQSVIDEEVEQFLGRKKYQRKCATESGEGYRNGYGPPRKLSTMSGTIEIRKPKLRGLEEKFESVIIPRFKRRTLAIEKMLPELYLHGLSLGDFDLALRGLLGDGAPLSASSIDRLRGKWEAEYGAWRHRRLDELKIVYIWADGIYVKAGLEKEKACLLVVIGADIEGRKTILAVESGYRESSESWASVLRDLKVRGLNQPRLTIADGNMGIWSALSQVYPESREQRCWNHKMRNVLDCLPKKWRKEAKDLLLEMFFAKSRASCEATKKEFERRFKRRYPRAVERLNRDWERMISFFDFPLEHWRHIRTTNVVESPFAAVRLRTGAAKRYKKVGNAVAVIWKILILQESVFRRLMGLGKLKDVYYNVKYVDGFKRLRSIAA
ncbi:MAG: IS256 family transposase [bacterium]